MYTVSGGEDNERGAGEEDSSTPSEGVVSGPEQTHLEYRYSNISQWVSPTCQGISFSSTTSPPTTRTGCVRFAGLFSGPKMPQFLELLNLLLFKICLEFLSDFLMDFSQHSFFLKTRRSIEIMAF